MRVVADRPRFGRGEGHGEVAVGPGDVVVVAAFPGERPGAATANTIIRVINLFMASPDFLTGAVNYFLASS